MRLCQSASARLFCRVIAVIGDILTRANSLARAKARAPQGGGDPGFSASCARRRSSRITNTPLAITTVAPVTSPVVGFADQHTQSIANAHKIDVYSNGPTTEGGA